MIWLLIGYMWLFIHRPFEEWLWLADLRIERVYMIFTIICWLISGPRLPRWNRLHTYFAAFVAVMITSWLVSPYQAFGQHTVENYLKYCVFYVLLVTSVRDKRDLRILMVGYVGVMTLFMAHSVREWFCGRVFWSSMGLHRLNGVGRTFYNPDDFAGLIVMSLPFGYLLWREEKTRWKRLAILGYFGLSLWCVMRTGSRMGFCGVLFAGFLAVLASPKRWRALAFAPLFLVGAWMLLPEEIQHRYLTLVDPSYGPPSAQKSAGRYRYAGFERGLRLLEERPLLGHGPRGSAAACGGTALHNTYGEVLGDLGMAGALAFGLIILGVTQNALEARRALRRVGSTDDLLAWRTVMAASAACVVLLFMGWGLHFLFWHVWLWFGAFQVVALNCLKQQAAYPAAREPVTELYGTMTPDTRFA